MSDKEKFIDKKIKELQNDLKLSFKMTDEVIDISYRKAVNDIQNFSTSNKESIKNSQNKSELPVKTISPNSLKYQEKLEEYLQNKDEFEKFLKAKNRILDGRQKRFSSKSDTYNLKEAIKQEKLDIYKKIIDKIEYARDLMTIYDYCRQEVEKINNDKHEYLWP